VAAPRTGERAAAVEARTLTTTEAAVLALLAIEGERSGYDLAQRVERAIGHIWAPARSGLYATLPRLVRDGLADARHVAQAARPDKQVYRIAAAGRDALAAWFATVEPGARETVLLKVFVGGLTTPDVLLGQLRQFEADAEARLETLREIEPTNTGVGHDWYHRHLLEYGLRRAELDRAFAEEVARAIVERTG
jgi:DNA-binding PadR family transcriptional regulator